MTTVACTLDPAQVTVGQKVKLSCKKEVPQGAKIEFKNEDATPYILEFLGQPNIEAGAVIQTVTSYRVGNQQLTHIKLKVDNTEYSVGPLSLNVESVISKQDAARTIQPTPFPIHDPVEVPIPWWWWAMVITPLVLALAYAISKYVNWRKQIKQVQEETQTSVPLSPEEKFRTRLRKLESRALHQKGEYKLFALELTQILKTTIGEKYGFPAEDLTTEEVLQTLTKRHSRFFTREGKRIQSVLGTLDQIKFAKTETTPQQCVDLIDQTAQMGNTIFGAVQ